LRIGVDLDGIVTRVGFYNPSLKLPWWLFFALMPAAIILKPDKTVVSRLKIMQDGGNEIIIVTARPCQSAQLTERWLKLHHVPFDRLICVGFGEGTNDRKLKVIQEEKMAIFVDNDIRLVMFMKKNSVNAVSTFEFFS